MNQNTLRDENRKLVLKHLQRVDAMGLSGVSADTLARRTKLCIRTVRTHLRTLRTEGLVNNEQGRWFITQGMK